MGVTFNLVDHGATRTGVYCHITDVMGPKKNSEINDGTDGHWYATYGLIIHQNQSARNNDGQGWPNRIPSQHIDRFRWTGANLSTYPTLAVLYADLKTKLANTTEVDQAGNSRTIDPLATNIADAV
jgi:hypothetical protein